MLDSKKLSKPDYTVDIPNPIYVDEGPSMIDPLIYVTVVVIFVGYIIMEVL